MENGKRSIREMVAAALDIPSEIVVVPEWDDVKLEMRGMSTGARGRFMQEIIGEDGQVHPDFTRYFADLLIACTYDPDTGEPAFTPDDRDMLNERSPGVTERLGAIGLRLSGLEAGSVDEGKGDSSKTTTDASSSDSPPTST